jgi:hypothetical protein
VELSVHGSTVYVTVVGPTPTTLEVTVNHAALELVVQGQRF